MIDRNKSNGVYSGQAAPGKVVWHFRPRLESAGDIPPVEETGLYTLSATYANGCLLTTGVESIALTLSGSANDNVWQVEDASDLEFELEREGGVETGEG